VISVATPCASADDGKRSLHLELLESNDNFIEQIIRKNSGIILCAWPEQAVYSFDNAGDAMRAAVQTQTVVDGFNLINKSAAPVCARISLHTGKGFKAVAIAMLCSENTNGAEILITGETLAALQDRDRYHSIFKKSVTFSAARDCSFHLHKIVWSPTEKPIAITAVPFAEEKSIFFGSLVLVKALIVAIPIMIMISLVAKSSETVMFFSKPERGIHLHLNHFSEHDK